MPDRNGLIRAIAGIALQWLASRLTGWLLDWIVGRLRRGGQDHG